MAERPACNASPLIILARAGHLDLLRAVYGRVVVPGAVAEELRRSPSDRAALALENESWLEREVIPAIAPVVAPWGLGNGEAEVLTWVLQHAGSEGVLDDRLGRRCAVALGVPIKGTVGVVLLAKRRGLIPAARPVLDTLLSVGLY